jgi:hypothetical protein
VAAGGDVDVVAVDVAAPLDACYPAAKLHCIAQHTDVLCG